MPAALPKHVTQTPEPLWKGIGPISSPTSAAASLEPFVQRWGAALGFGVGEEGGDGAAWPTGAMVLCMGLTEELGLTE